MALPHENPSTSLWLENPPLGEIQPAIGNFTQPPPRETDILVIGAGISGASVAYHLQTLSQDKTTRLKVTVVDARGIAGGASGRNGGILWNSPGGLTDSKTPTPSELRRTHALHSFYSANVEALQSFIRDYLARRICTSDPDPADPLLYWYEGGGVTPFLTAEERDSSLHTLEFLLKNTENPLGLEYWDADRTVTELCCAPNAFPYGALRQREQVGRVWAARLVRAIAEEAIRLSEGNVDIYCGWLVEEVKAGTERRRWQAKLRQDSDELWVDTDYVVYATNAYTGVIPREAADGLSLVPVRNQVVASDPLPPEVLSSFRARNFAISADHGYIYMTVRQDGRIVLGGMRNLVTDGVRKSEGLYVKEIAMDEGNADDRGGSWLNPLVSTRLRQWVGEVWPDLSGKVHFTQEWSGILGFTPSHHPYVRPLPLSGQYLLAGFSGHGMPQCFLAGKLIAAYVLEDALKFRGVVSQVEQETGSLSELFGIHA